MAKEVEWSIGSVRRKVSHLSKRQIKKLSRDSLREAYHLKQISDNSESHRDSRGVQGKVSDAFIKSGYLLEALGNIKDARKAYETAEEYSNSRAIYNQLEGRIRNLGFQKKEVGYVDFRKGAYAVAILSIASFLAGLFFISTGFTGAVIGGGVSSKNQWFSLLFVALGIVFAIAYFRMENFLFEGKSKRRK